MKPSVTLINTSRGKLIDTKAVIDGIKSGQIGSLGLDVYEQEDSLFFRDLSGTIIQDDYIQLLQSFPNVLITSHQGFFTEEAISAIANTTITSITDFEQGNPLKDAISYQLSVISYQLSVISYQLSVISYQFTEKTPHTPHPTPYTLHPTPYTLHPTPYTLHPTPHTPHSIPRTIFGTRLSLKSEIDDFFKDRVKFMADIVDIAVSADNFKTLVTAVQAANLVDALKSPGPFTVFAPTDEAFAKLPPGTITTLVQNIPQLTRILTYHVVAGKYMQEDLAKLAVVTSLEGSPIPVDCSEGFEVKNATVVAGNIEADNGVIHVIDTVILMG